MLEEYIERYRQLHTGERLFYDCSTNTPLDYTKYNHEFDGMQFTSKFIPTIESYIQSVNKSITILDYGCGKGTMPWRGIKTYPNGVWGHFKQNVQAIWLYDPCNPPLSERPPEGLQFDVVGAADVLEHVPEEAVPDVIKDIDHFTKPSGLIILSTCGIPALKSFDDGENLHCTLKDAKWWANMVIKHTKKQFTIIYQGAERTSVIQGNKK